MTQDETTEKMIQAKGKTAPRVTPAAIDAAIVSEHYFTAEEGHVGSVATGSYNPDPTKYKVPGVLSRLTFCVLVLRNGYTVTGESACVSPDNFDAAIGKKIARENARQKIWVLEGYLLQERLHTS
jgi:Phage protein (N4 Gp49/phage Sf6 gene 66) family